MRRILAAFAAALLVAGCGATTTVEEIKAATAAPSATSTPAPNAYAMRTS